MPIAAVYVPPAIYNILVTFITGGVSMIIFFFVFKIIFRRERRNKEITYSNRGYYNNSRYRFRD